MKIQLRHDTAANWTSANPVLDKGEFGAEDDTALFKKGDGVTAWNDLAYANNGTGMTQDAADARYVKQADIGDLKGADGKDGQIRFTGHGAPGTIIGANPGDTYMNLDNGDIYKLS